MNQYIFYTNVLILFRFYVTELLDDILDCKTNLIIIILLRIPENSLHSVFLLGIEMYTALF